MRFSIRLNNDLAPDEYLTLARLAEAQGFDQFWISNDLFLRSCLALLPVVARGTSRIEIGTGILNPYTVNPAEIAMFAATMDELSGNRFNLGLAAGAADFLRWVGLGQPAPIAMIRETIEAVRRLQTGRPPDSDGRMLQWTDEAYLRFEPARQTPIYVGAMGPKMLALSGELADGVLPLLFPPEHYFEVLPYVEKGLAGRPDDLGPLDMAACIWVSLSEDRSAARLVLAEKIAYYGHSLGPLLLERLGLTKDDFAAIDHAMMVERDKAKAISLVDSRMLRIGVVGGANEVIERLEPLVAAGVQHLSFGPPLGPDMAEALRILGEAMRYFRP